MPFSMNAYESNDDIEVEDLPKSAKFIINNHFGAIDISSIVHKEHDKSYLVKFKDGKKIMFDAIGDWIYIDCKNEFIPLLLVPSWIRNQIAKKYGPYTHPVQMSKDKRKIKIKLSNQVELELK